MIGRCVAVLAGALFLASTAVAQRRGGELVVTGDGIVPATLNGTPGRIRIDPAVPALPMLSTRWAGQAQLRPGPFAFGVLVGPQQIDGVTAVARIGVGVGGEQRRRRVGWTRLPYIRNADGVVRAGRPAASGHPLRAPPLAAGRADGGAAHGERGRPVRRLGRHVRAGRCRRRAAAGPFRSPSSAHPRHRRRGVRLAQAYEGRVAGEAESVAITFGISRPVRALRLARPLEIGPLSLPVLGVRTADFGSAAAIREENGDPDEIVVIGEARANPRDRITLGADALARCSAIVFDKRARQVRLTCA